MTKDPYPKGHNHPSQILTEVDELLIIHLVLDRPSIYLHEIQKELAETNRTAIFVQEIKQFPAQKWLIPEETRPSGAAKK